MLSDLSELPSLKIGDFTLQFELGPPCAEIQEVARKELRESSELQKESMERLKELLAGEPINKTRNIAFKMDKKYNSV